MTGAASGDFGEFLSAARLSLPDQAHGTRCARHAGRLFDDLREALALPPDDRVLVVVSALLHDIGYTRGARDHHRKAYDIISESDLPGVAAADRAIVACAARYHGRSMPSIEHAGFGELDAEGQRRVRRAAAIVRVAAAGDASHLGLVTALTAAGGTGGVVFLARAGAEPAVERDRLREAAGGFAALTYIPASVTIEIGPEHESE